MFQWVERKAKPVMHKREEHVNLNQQGSAVLYNWSLPVICEFERIEPAND